MSVRLKGEASGECLERRWALIATKGDGPDIPTLAAVILADAILAGGVTARRAAGASPADARRLRTAVCDVVVAAPDR